jgi:4-hydroxybenzoyl-CoA thioesterase/acyl-CoA thioester hydrolase
MSASSLPIFTWERRVEFSETDAAGIAHFSSFFIYMEQAEHALFRHCGWSIFPSRSETTPPESLIVSWPRVHCACDFKGPAFFEDQLSIDLSIERLGNTSITYRHVIRRESSILAIGRVTTVCSRVDSRTHQMTAYPIPDHIRDRFQARQPGNQENQGTAEHTETTEARHNR